MRAEVATSSFMMGIVLLGASYAPASANWPASGLRKFCTGQSIDKLICKSYIEGVIETFYFADRTLEKTRLGSAIFTCVPSDASEDAQEAVVERYVTEHPEKDKYSAVSVIGSALTEAYPCPKSN